MKYIKFKANVDPLEPGRDILVAELAELGFESFVETESGIEAFIQITEFKKENIQGIQLLSNANFNIDYSTELIADQNWNAEWEKNFELINVENRCCIRAPFHNKIDNIEYDIVIDPKMSFGTGHHETTYLMVKRLLDLKLESKKVLDMGCGTAVLAILAKLKGAKPIEAIDIDEWAYNNALENIRNNNCEEIKVKKGGSEQIDGYFDIILANINRNILLSDMDKYVNALNKGGYLLLSGFFSSDKELLIESTTKLGLKLDYSEIRNDWMMLHLIKE